jgi:hypothetical protein
MYQRRFESMLHVKAPAEAVFDFVDDHGRLVSHMMNSSTMMAGGRMTIGTDAAHGRAVGSHITLSGTVLGLRLFLDEVITRRDPPLRKEWETVGTPRLVIIGAYRMGTAIESAADGSGVSVFIDYDLRRRLGGRILGWLLAGFYARWCVRQMLAAVAAEFQRRGPLLANVETEGR